MRILSATGALGATPFDVDSFQRGLERDPHMVGGDAGSNDVGPYGLGSDTCYFPREWVKHDLRQLLLGARTHGIPMAVGTAGHMGTDNGVEYHAELIEEIAREEGLAPSRPYEREIAERSTILRWKDAPGPYSGRDLVANLDTDRLGQAGNLVTYVLVTASRQFHY